MTSLRAKFLRELTIRGRAERTSHAYVACLAALAKHYGLPPDRIGDEQIRDWLEHLRSARKLSASSLNVTVNAVRAFQEWVLDRPREDCVRGVPTCKRPVKRAEVYAQCEIKALLDAAAPGRNHMLLTVLYACGLRRAEAVQLQIGDIDGPRLQLRVRCGKGSKERVLPLADHLLADLRAYWRDHRKGRPGHDSPWLFQGAHPGRPMSNALAQQVILLALLGLTDDICPCLQARRQRSILHQVHGDSTVQQGRQVAFRRVHSGGALYDLGQPSGDILNAIPRKGQSHPGKAIKSGWLLLCEQISPVNHLVQGATTHK